MKLFVMSSLLRHQCNSFAIDFLGMNVVLLHFKYFYHELIFDKYKKKLISAHFMNLDYFKDTFFGTFILSLSCDPNNLHYLIFLFHNKEIFWL